MFERKIKGDTIFFKVISRRMGYSPSSQFFTRRDQLSEVITVDLKSKEFIISYEIIKNTLLSTYNVFSIYPEESKPENVWTLIQGGFDDYEYDENDILSLYDDRTGDKMRFKKNFVIVYLSFKHFN